METLENESDGSWLVSEKIIQKINKINSWYEHWQGDVWLKAKVERPDLIQDLFESSDAIDREYDRYKAKKATWDDIEKRLVAYFGCWQKIAEAYPR